MSLFPFAPFMFSDERFDLVCDTFLDEQSAAKSKKEELGSRNGRRMSRAFIKEDVDLPERSGRKRSASGLPPGATNYITARGAKRLRDELQKLRAVNAVSERVTELEQVLASVHVVDPPDAPSNSVTFGATVTVKDKKGATETFTIVGVDELNFERDAVSWISPLGKALLAADMGHWIKLDDGRSAKIVKIEFKTASDIDV
jgi:transcription elongation GreA/GreB family factor